MPFLPGSVFEGELLHLPGARLSSQREARQELVFSQGWSSQLPGLPGLVSQYTVASVVHGVEESTQVGLSCPGLQVARNFSELEVTPNRIVSSLSSGIQLDKLTRLYIQKSPSTQSVPASQPPQVTGP